ncbi:MAG: ATP-binding protein [Clostridium butyricum]|nr:ATP-binding protein [Clostridium butyricum]
MVIIDFIVTVLQGVFIGYALNKCLDENSKIKFWSIILISVFISSDALGFICNKYIENTSIISNILFMAIVAFIYRNNIKGSLTVYSICMAILGIFLIVSSNIILASINMIFCFTKIELGVVFFVYIPQIFLIMYLIKNIELIKSFYKFIVCKSMEMSVICISLISYFISTSYKVKLGEYSQLIKNGLQIIFGACLIALVLYFNKIYNESKKISVLNEALENKNNELRKIKHDYGAQISYLYGLALMGRNDDLKKSLKNIINVNQNTPEAVEVRLSAGKDEESVLSLAVKSAINKGINVILEENYDLKLLEINELELYRIITNIVNNAIKAMEGKGRIIIKSYELMNNIIIEIENNGPKIPEENIESLFKPRFTTKNNSDKSHGYGLSIVKELVEKNCGNISVKSTDEKTVFKISFNNAV